MSEDQDAREIGMFVAGAAFGALVGAGVALMYAPQSGRRTRGKLRRGAEDLAERAEETVDGAREDARRAARDVRKAAEESGERVKRSVRDRRERSGL